MSFRASNEAAFRQLVRAAIRKSDMTKGEQAVALAVANLWFHHRNGPEGIIRPGRQRLALKARVSVRTVASTLAMLRAASVLVAVEYAKGGPEDLLVQITAVNRGPEAAELHLLPTLWFRNDWSSWISRPDPGLLVGVQAPDAV